MEHFAQDVENYTNTTDGDPGAEEFQYSVSPIALVAAATNIPPVRLYTTIDDSVPHQQSDAMLNALLLKDADVAEYTIQNSNLHAFAYWHTLNTSTGEYVSVEVIDFLQSHLP